MILTASWAGTGDRGNPEVGGASVEDHCEVLRWGANGDGPVVLHLQGSRTKGCFQGMNPGLELPQTHS